MTTIGRRARGATAFGSLFVSWFTSLSLLLLARPAAADDRAVSLESLLREMTSREGLARWPMPAYTCGQASSHDRRKTNPADAATWHSNQDYEQFIRVEQNEGRKEWVILEHQGPGAIARVWLPLHAPRDKQVIRFYFDGSPTPAIAVKFNELLSGRSFVPPPFAFVAWDETDVRGQQKTPPKLLRNVAGDLYLPIPFARSCKITLDELPFYYIINYRAYEPGTAVRTFTMADYQAARSVLERAAENLTAGPSSARSSTDEGSGPSSPRSGDRSGSGTSGLAPPTHGDGPPGQRATLAPGEELSLALPPGPAAVRALWVKIDPDVGPRAARSLILSAIFDDEPTAWCPVGDFFGAGARLRPVWDRFRSTEKDGTLRAGWVMPYQRSGRLSLKNAGEQPVAVQIAAATGPWEWDDRSMYFHADWHAQFDMKTQPRSDWNYVEIRGQGVYAGDTLTVYSPSPAWYGEGDERVYVDGEKFPSHIGTGTEDYYGYAWGMADYFSSPFISMPQRDSSGRENWKGYTTTSRVRLLDTIPFRTSLKHDMEIWHWADTKVDYAVGVFWYGRPGAKSNRQPRGPDAARPLHPMPPDPRAKLPGVIECETLAIESHSPGLHWQTQDVSSLPTGQWSGGQQLFVKAEKVGDFVTLQIPVGDDRPRKLVVYATKSYDYGVLRFSVNGQQAGKDFDGYHAEPINGGPIDLGTVEPKGGKLLLRVEVVGANAGAKRPGAYFGLDCVELRE